MSISYIYKLFFFYFFSELFFGTFFWNFFLTKKKNTVLVEGLVNLCKAKPVGNAAVRWLGEWLVANNPARPVGAGTTTTTTTTSPAAIVSTTSSSLLAPSAPQALSQSSAPFPGGMARAQYANQGVVVTMPPPAARTIVFVLGGPGKLFS